VRFAMKNYFSPRAGTATLVLVAAAAFVLVLLSSARASASSFVFKTPEATESSGQWHLKVRIDLSRPPAMMHTPMRFTFSKLAVDERSIMTKGGQPEHHRMVLDTQPKQIVSLDVDFADPSGKVFKSTYFEFDVERASGYFEAGEYLVTLSGADGEVGAAQKLLLKGDNPPVYRGAMDFTDPKAAKKKKGPDIQAVSSGIDAGSGGSDDEQVAAAHSTVVTADGPAPSMVPQSAYNKTAEEEGVQDHPKGCGCVAAGTAESPFAGAAALLLAGLLGITFVARRRAGGAD
jgi:MYXO-CTERM domain-containing protein